MSLETAQDDLEQYIDTNWTYTAKQFLNSDNGTTPEVPLSQGAADYISVQVLHGRSIPAEIGAGLNGNKRSTGILQILIHIRRGRGSRTVGQYLDYLVSLLEYKKIGIVNMKSFLVAPDITENKWFVTPVLYDFYFDR